MFEYKDYNLFRNRIGDGDVILIGGPTNSILAKTIKTVTRSNWYHAGIAFWDKDRLMLAEAYAPTRRIITLSAYSDKQIARISAPVVWSKIEASVKSKTGVVAYGYADLLTIAIKERLGVNIGDPKGEVCSEMVAKELTKGGLKGLTQTPSPERLRKDLDKLGYKVADIYVP